MKKPSPYAFKLQNNSNETVKYALFRKKDRVYDNKILEPKPVVDYFSYDEISKFLIEKELKFNRICVYSDSIIQKRLPVTLVCRDSNGQSATIPVFLDENEEINTVNLSVKTDELEIMILPNSTSIIYLYETINNSQK